MSRESTLIKNTAIITIGKLCTQLVTFFLLPLYTAILSAEEYGTVDLLNTLVALLLPVVTLQIEQGIFRELIEVRDDLNKQRKIISSGILAVVIQSIIYLIIFGAISPFIHNEFKYFLATNLIAYIFTSLFLQISRGLGENKIYAFSGFLNASTTILFNILFLLVFRLGAYGMLLGTMLGNVICVAYLFFSLKLYKYIKVASFRKNTVKKLLVYSIPLIPNAISWWVFNASDRVIVSLMLGLSQNGILSAASKFSMVYITIYNIFNVSWTESISLHINDFDIEKFFNRTFDTVLRLFTSLGLGIIVFMPFVYGIMINSKFSDGYVLVPIYIIASLLNVVVGLISVIYVAKKNTKAIANTSVVSALSNIIIHLLLIKFIGLYAAAISTFASFFVISMYRLYDINKRYFRIQINKKFLGTTIIVIIIILTTYYINNLWLNIISIFIVIAYSWLINKNSLLLILNTFKNKFIKS